MIIHSETARKLIKDHYNSEDIHKMLHDLAPALNISLTERGFLRASDRTSLQGDPTHYDAVWVRDSMWAYLAFVSRVSQKKKAQHLLNGIVRYFSSPSQIGRLRAVIKNPDLANEAVDGSMNVIHVRFDGTSPVFDDVKDGGFPQKWNHKQNDALGLFYLCLLDAIAQNQFHLDLSDSAWEFVLRLPTYFKAIKFFEMEDAGCWEEIERINTSSVALVTSSLEILKTYLCDKNFYANFLSHFKSLNLKKREECIFDGSLDELIEKGYQRLFLQIPRGESPNYPKENHKYRESDSALLNILFPARLERLTSQQSDQILKLVKPLVREIGIIRYIGDSYQCGNYWVRESTGSVLTSSYSHPAQFQKRQEGMAPGSEAQWFFDSWLSKIYGLLYLKSHSSAHKENQILFFNRALTQLTGDKMQGADGKLVPPLEFPESYNTLINEKGDRELVPSPITPLNWAKASMGLALESLRDTCR